MDYVFGMARNERLRQQIEEAMAEAAEQQQATGKPARVCTEFEYQTRQSWSRARRVVSPFLSGGELGDHRAVLE